jgi:hypothetical protein
MSIYMRGSTLPNLTVLNFEKKNSFCAGFPLPHRIYLLSCVAESRSFVSESQSSNIREHPLCTGTTNKAFDCMLPGFDAFNSHCTALRTFCLTRNIRLVKLYRNPGLTHSGSLHT